MVQNRPQYLRALATAAVVAFAFAANAITYSNRYRSPRNPERPIRKSTRLIVLHTTEAHARSSLNKLQERGEAHYCVVENGTVYRIVDREREAFHAGRSMWQGKEDCDTYSVGIEVVGHHDKPVTLQQLDALRELVGNLKKIYNLKDDQVVCHSHVAYGAPNKWHKQKHRGRKRCGMLFAMQSVRNKLNLSSKPKIDPDVRARRLVQADTYLGQVLYGSIDTMASHYNRRPAASATKAQPPKKKKGGIMDSIKSIFKRGELKKPEPAPASAPAKPATKKPTPAPAPSKPTWTKPAAQTKSGTSVSAQTKPAPSGFVKGKLKGGSASQPVSRPSVSAAPAPRVDPKRDLAMLRAKPGYVEGGPTSATLTPYKIAGPRWRSPDTYYYFNGTITRGDRIDEKRILPGTIIFYKK